MSLLDEFRRAAKEVEAEEREAAIRAAVFRLRYNARQAEASDAVQMYLTYRQGESPRPTESICALAMDVLKGLPDDDAQTYREHPARVSALFLTGTKEIE